MIRFALPLAAFAVLVAVLAVGLTLNPREVPSPLVGKPMPAFDLPRVRFPEQRLRADQLRGEVSLVNFWAEWCVGCRVEHPLLLRVAEQGHIAIYGVNYKDDRSKAIAWLDADGDPYTASGTDADGSIGIEFGVYGLPETFVIDSDGRIAYKHIGPITEDDWNDKLLPIIRRLKAG